MKNRILFILAAVLLVSLFCVTCAAEAPVRPDGHLLLTVSDITFGTVGESEYIYTGSAPLDEVYWESLDPDIISVENGTLTAVGVGSAELFACYQDELVFFHASCLARDTQELNALPLKVLCQPKRIPPDVDIDPAEFFSDAVFIGDSGSYNMMLHEKSNGLLGHPLFLARKNISVFNFYNYLLDLNYQGQSLSVEDAVAACGRKKVFLLLGTNDLGYQTAEEAAQRYGVVIDRILEKSPDVQIYIQTSPPFYYSPQPFPSFNEKMDLFNDCIRQMAAEKGCHVVDLAAYIEDQWNNMAYDYSLDFQAHLNEAGCIIWMKVLRAYACCQMMAG